MCGIVGIVGSPEDVASPILDALRRLEYRGYDLTGIATIIDGRIERRRAAGKLSNLARLLNEQPLPGRVGIGHTRWATHGGPTADNAHPHATAKVAAVHNGIIENFRDLRLELERGGVVFQSETDSEIIVHLITRFLESGLAPLEAARQAFRRLEGGSAILVMFAQAPDLLVGARLGRALAIGHGKGTMYIGTDALALAPFTSNVTYLEDGDIAAVTAKGATIIDLESRPVQRPKVHSTASATIVDKGNHRHFMAKEIHEQPDVVGYTLGHYLDLFHETLLPVELPQSAISRVTITACGTAYLAGLVAKHWIERLARIPVEVEVASELRYREPPLDKGGLTIAISQSGETADTLAAIRYCKEQGQKIAAIVNVPESSIARQADFLFPTLAGPEIGVASTKAFTCQLSVLATLALNLAKAKGLLSAQAENQAVKQLESLPRLIETVLKGAERIKAAAHDLSKAHDVLFLGRGSLHPIALEGALKLKEISYIHAEGYAAGEMKHGPIALIDEGVPIVVLAPTNVLFEKTVSNLQEAAARGGRILLLSDRPGLDLAGEWAATTLEIPVAPELLQPILATIPLQLLAYYAAVARGTDVDQPRNLAKSVTVE